MFCNDSSFITFLYLFVKVTKNVCMMKECACLFITPIISAKNYLQPNIVIFTQWLL